MFWNHRSTSSSDNCRRDTGRPDPLPVSEQVRHTHAESHVQTDAMRSVVRVAHLDAVLALALEAYQDQIQRHLEVQSLQRGQVQMLRHVTCEKTARWSATRPVQSRRRGLPRDGPAIEHRAREEYGEVYRMRRSPSRLSIVRASWLAWYPGPRNLEEQGGGGVE